MSAPTTAQLHPLAVLLTFRQLHVAVAWPGHTRGFSIVPSLVRDRSSALQHGWTRRRVLAFGSTVALVGAPAWHADASFGESAVQAPPAFVPSPMRPTGAMADTCEVVALGREDVCLEPKKLITSYEKLLLSKADSNIAEALMAPQNPMLTAVLQSVRRQIALGARTSFALALLSAPVDIHRFVLPMAPSGEQQV